jgi:membrane dipeptidase
LKLVAQKDGIVMVCFLPGYLIEPERVQFVAGEAEKERLRKLHPDDPAKAESAMDAWRRAQPRGRPATLSDVADHIDHLRQVMGIDHVGIGSDFEGFHGAVKGLEDVSCYPALLAELLRRGYTKEEIKKVAGLNLLRVMREVEKVAAQLQKPKS